MLITSGLGVAVAPCLNEMTKTTDPSTFGTVVTTISGEVLAGVGKMKMDDVTRGVVPFIIAEFIIMFVMVAFPQLVIWPAKLMHGG